MKTIKSLSLRKERKSPRQKQNTRAKNQEARGNFVMRAGFGVRPLGNAAFGEIKSSLPNVHFEAKAIPCLTVRCLLLSSHTRTLSYTPLAHSIPNRCRLE